MVDYIIFGVVMTPLIMLIVGLVIEYIEER
jgi:uncharacterized membrane protein